MIIKFKSIDGSLKFTQVDELKEFIKKTYPLEGEEFLEFAVTDTIKVLEYIQSRFMSIHEFSLTFRDDLKKFELSYCNVMSYRDTIFDTITRTWNWYIGDGRKL